jgi:sensor histidine kinase regulating citrate/malate metabolism
MNENLLQYLWKYKIFSKFDFKDTDENPIGIAESDLERVFERGFSGFNGRRTQQSSGLGLYLSRKIAAELGYSLKLSSKVGQGTEVRIGIKEVELVLD